MAIVLMESFDSCASLGQKQWSGNPGLTTGYTGNCGSFYANWVTDSSSSASKALPGSYSEIVICARVKFVTGARSGWTWRLFEGSTIHIEVSLNASFQLQIKRDAGGTLLATGVTALAEDTWYYIAMRANIDDTNGSIIVKLDDQVEIDEQGLDTKNGGTGVINTFGITQNHAGFGTGALYSYIDDLVIMDTTGSDNNDLIYDGKIEALYPNGNGTYSDFVGSDGNSTDNYLLVDEAPPDDDTSYVESSTITNFDTYVFQNMTITDNPVRAVQVNSFAKKNDAGLREIVLNATVSGVDWYSLENITLETSYRYFSEILELDPNGVPWNNSSVNSAEFGIGVVA